MWPFKGPKPQLITRYPDAKIIANREVKIRDEKGRCVIVEFPPAVRSIQTQFSIYGEPSIRRLAFPYLYFVTFIYDGINYANFVFYTNSKAESGRDALFYSNLTNVWSDGHICMLMLAQDRDETLEVFVARIIEEFWSSIFSDDLPYYWIKYSQMIGHPQTFSEWESLSKKDPVFITNLSWLPSDYTLDSITHAFE